MKLATKRSLIQTHSSHASGSGADEGTGDIPGVPDVPTYGSDDEQISWKSSEEEEDDEVGMNEDDDNNDDDTNNDDDVDKDDEDDDAVIQDDENPDDANQDDDDEQTDSDSDGDDFFHPKLSTHYDEARQDDELNEEESDEESDDESNEERDKEVQGAKIEEEEMDEEATHEEDKANELYKDSSSVSSGFVTNMLNPSPDTGIDSLFNLNTESILLVDVPVTTVTKPPLLSATTLPPPPTPLIIHLQQTPVPTPATVPSSSLQDLPNFGSLFRFDHRLKTLENDFLEFKKMNQFAVAISLIPNIVDTYLANKMNEAVKTAIQLQSDRLRDEAQAKNEDFLNKLDDNIKKIIKDQVKEQVKAQTCHTIAANLSELELKKILIDKMEINKDDEDKDEEPSVGSNRGSKRRRARKEPESTSAPKEKTFKTTGKSTEGSKYHHKSADESAQAEETMHTAKHLEEPAHQEFKTGVTEDQPDEETSYNPDWFQKPTRPPSPDHDWNKTLPDAHGPVQPWISSLAQMEGLHDSFNELMDTPLDFLAFVMNRLKVDTLTPELLTGLTFKLMKGSCKSLVELEYFLEEVYKATTDQLDWNNPEGQQYPHDLRKPLPLIPNSRGRQVIPFDHFINNDLAYLSGGVSSRKYTTSVTKTKAADYGHIK
ncbi:hypothetical protein Tco_0514795 [Tanacetum coccineum]